MLSAKFLKAHSEVKHGKLYNLGERAFAWMTASEYERGLRAVLRRQKLVLGVTVGTIVLTVYLFMRSCPRAFFPQQDTGRIGGSIRGQQDVSFDAISAKATEMVNIVRKEPGVLNVMMFLGGGGPAAAGPTLRICSFSWTMTRLGRRMAGARKRSSPACARRRRSFPA